MEKFSAANHQEKKQSTFERIGKAKAAIFGAFLSTLSAHNAEAMDFGAGTDWLAGAVTMEYGAKSEPNEFAGIYVEVESGKGTWSNPVDGEHGSVGVNFGQDEQSIIEHISENISETVFRVCVAHTHPNDALDGYMYGPSIADLNIDREFSRIVKNDIEKHLESIAIQVESVVFEKYGVWYYSSDGVNTQNIVSEIEGTNLTINQLAQGFTNTIENPNHTDFELKQSILKVKLGLFQQGIGSRFVLYDDFYKEPPCAGVTYRPQS